MVVHEGNDSSMEVDVIKKSLLENTSYVFVKNHVKELSNTQRPSNTSKEKLDNILVNDDSKKKFGKAVKKNNKTVSNVPATSTLIREVDTDDLNELRTLYTKCKNVIKKIEKKYGHLLDLNDSEVDSSKCTKRRIDTHNSECQCIKKKKIVFDDEGKQSTVDLNSDIHICVEKLKNVSNLQTQARNIEVEYQDGEIDLPDNLQELSNILHDSRIEKTHRNKVLAKIRVLKQEYSNDIKFNKPILIEKLKSNCDEVLDFKGTNLSIISGYS